MKKSVGQVLQDARTRRGLDLNDAERVTKIRLKFLRAIEEDRWEALPEPVYVRSFLSTYARFLGLDDGPLLEEYGRTADTPDRPDPIPPGAIRAGGIRPHRRPLKPVLIAGAGVAAVIVLGLVIVGLLSDTGGGGTTGSEKRGGERRAPSGAPAVAPTSTAAGSEVSLDLRPTAAVWVCLIDSRDHTLLAETLQPGDSRGPFNGRSFDVTFGNGSIELTVDGQAAKVPPIAEPLGYRITPAGIHRLDSASEPTCT
jgi:cytoskeleton protein RodZ